MVKAKRIERVAALSKLLADHPYRLFSFSYFLSSSYFLPVLPSFRFVYSQAYMMTLHSLHKTL